MSFVCLISMSAFSLTSMADENIVIHKGDDVSCTEMTVSRQMYNMIPDLAANTSKGTCPPINAKGNEMFGGCKDLQGDDFNWYYDVPEFYSDSNFKAEIEAGCAEWAPARSQ